MDYKLKAQMLLDLKGKYVLIETNKPCKPDYICKLNDDITDEVKNGYFKLRKGTNLDDLDSDFIGEFIESGKGHTIRISLENLVAVTEL